MSDQHALLDLMDEIQAFPKEKIKPSTTPVSIILHEADSLHARGTYDLPKLTAVGMQADLLDRIKKLISALRIAQISWEEQKTEKQKAKAIWEVESNVLYSLRRDLLESMSFTFRKQKNLMQNLRAIKKGRSHAKAIQDLANLAILGNANKQLLNAIHFDIAKCDKAASEADRIAHILGAVNGHLHATDKLKSNRDIVSVLLLNEINELLAYGRFAFRNQPDKLASYAHKYKRELNAKAYRKRQAKQNQ